MTQLTQINQAQKPAVPDNLKPQPERSKLHQNVNNVSSQHSFDPEALIKKYAEEREKRLRHNGGLEQYRTIDGQFSHLLTDPYVAEQLERKPIVEQCEALVIGGGYGAQLVAVELLRNGIKDIRIVEKGGDFGGTWYWSVF
jgi:cyclohexanone monooxygenase